METLTIKGSGGGVDDYGYPLPGGADREIVARRIQPLNLEEMSDEDRDGTVDALRVWCDPGSEVRQGDEVDIRGLVYKVVKTPWDWSRNRRPALSSHRPSLVFDARRGEA